MAGDDEQAIRELVESWMKASEAGNIATVLSLMTDDVVFMVPGREPFGKEAFEAASSFIKTRVRSHRRHEPCEPGPMRGADQGGFRALTI